ncbi:MAG: hypothetical protein Q7J45_00910 [bacterium]|nr:hypothetical protein [bacterium]
MKRDPVLAQYTDQVRNLLIHTFNLPEKEMLAQDTLWNQLIETRFNPQKFLGSNKTKGLQARLLAILLAPRDLTPFLWKGAVPKIEIEPKEFSLGLQKFHQELCRHNEKYASATCSQ